MLNEIVLFVLFCVSVILIFKFIKFFLKETKKAVLNRDDYTCFICHRKSKSNHVHHIIPFQKSLDNQKTNLITLCNSCHKHTENLWCRYGMTHFLDQMITHARYRE